MQVALETARLLENEDISVRVVSMPCLDLFEQQDAKYKESILPHVVTKRAVIEAGSSMSWGKYIGIDGCYITMDSFGASAPAGKLFEKYGFTSQNALNRIREKLM